MEITIFAKKRQTREGKTFYSYLGTLTRKDGSQITASIRFREDCPAPKPDICPLNIVFDKRAANLSKHDYIREDTGEPGVSYTLWVSGWEPGTPYEDHSLDEFED